MQLIATGQFPDFSLLSQLPWIRRAPNSALVRQETGARDQSHRSKHVKVSPGGVGQEHGLPRLTAVFTCLLGATHYLARQDRLWKLLKSPRGCRANLSEVGCCAAQAEGRLLLRLHRLFCAPRRTCSTSTKGILQKSRRR